MQLQLHGPLPLGYTDGVPLLQRLKRVEGGAVNPVL